MKARLSILGLYQYDKTIFDDMELPSSDFALDYEDLYITPLALDKETLVFSILSELSQYSVIYPDTDFMKMAISAWSRRKLWTWQKAYESFYFKYNPLWNKDGKITNTDLETRNLKTTGTSGNNVQREKTGTSGNTRTLDTTRTDNFTESLNYGGTETENGSASNTNERGVSAYNDTGYQAAERIADNGTTNNSRTTGGTDTTTNGGTSKDSGTIKDSGTTGETETETESGTTSETDTGTVKHEHSSYERGNIGVTMTQQLIEADRQLYLDNIYDIIIRDFKNEFCVLVY